MMMFSLGEQSACSMLVYSKHQAALDPRNRGDCGHRADGFSPQLRSNYAARSVMAA
jgi:hypothetical protein